MRKTTRIGILGGAFNPIHIGHLVLAEEARKFLGLKKVIFVPTNLPPHKGARELASARNRLRMVLLATKPNPSFCVSDLEIKRGGISYSIETVKELKSTFRRVKLYFIVGSDFLKEFSRWKDKIELSKICKFAIAPRPGFPLKKVPQKMQVIEISVPDVSSSDIRRRIKTNKSICHLVPEEVRKYILKKRLYRDKIKKIKGGG
jgi:nicotinate-nucleotide adenylyltransferase